MPTLESLPDELQLMIWNFIQPNDIDSYSLASPQIRALAPSILKEHRWLKNHFTSVISYQSAPGEHKEAQHIKTFHLLEIITAYPTHSLYVKNVTIGEGDSRHCFATTRRFEEYWEILSRIWLSVLVHTHITSDPNKVLPLPKQVVNWIDYAKHHRLRGPILAILLASLPKLTSLEFNEIGADDPSFLDVMEAYRLSPDFTVLSNLTSVNLLRIQQGNEATPWKVLRIFFNLPSLKVLKASGLQDTSGIARDEIAKFSKEGNSNVTDLSLQHCDMAEWSIQILFGLFKSLNNFNYDGMSMRSPIKPIPAHETQVIVFLKYLKIEYPLVRRLLALVYALPSSYH